MKVTQATPLFADLSAEESQTVQGGCRRRFSHRPSYSNFRPTPSFSYVPSFSYGYGYGGFGGSSGSVNQVVNVNVRYED